MAVQSSSFTALIILGTATAIPVFAAVDPYAETVAYIDWSVNYSNKVRGKAYAITSNPSMTKINVTASFYQDGTKKESGTGSTTNLNQEAYWLTKDGVYDETNSYSMDVASRTYYSGGSYDQQYASTTW
ncbi:hypothetical protein COLU111180_01250 [Cohnella lubricantis]|uniref:Uncharacterized protein n=1 Tax=Cohnella lubricantis TaxID=2163172 RepID=A0A841TI13_9BACL|nr:hypothetical protein [Cohnella lubricantis]MBB6678878.1 hypothetical protein [Cohnella lubricantis]MBP2120203.1 hypothetical protein [Cohnella lubricantis]